MSGAATVVPPPPETMRRPGGPIWLVHSARVGLVVAVFWLIHDQYRRQVEARHDRPARRVSIAEARRFFPNAVELTEPSADGRQSVLDGTSAPIGYVVQTSPASDGVSGFSGPTNCLVALDLEHRAVGVLVLESGDTAEHVAMIRRDPRFLAAFSGRTWDQLAQGAGVDAVSGATLTSLAIREGIAVRLGGHPPNLRFPRELTVDELRELVPGIERLTRRTDEDRWDVWRGTERLGSVLRTSPWSDQRIGYQGPTDTLIVLDADDRVREIRLRDTFDNEPYVQYVREDSYFRGIFRGRTLAEIASMSVPPPGIEGVSGATMTSQAMAAGVVEAARGALRQQGTLEPRARASSWFGVEWRWRDLGTIVVLFLGILTATTHLRGSFAWRVTFQGLLVGYLGFFNGDLLSQAQLVGWAQSGAPWRLAPGLVVLTLVSLAAPVATKRPLYCQHLCPYGAAQHLVRLRTPWRLRLGTRVTRWLLCLPGVLLVVVIGSAMWGWPIGLAQLEPFDAFVFWIAGWASISLALGGVFFSALVPMGYCRFGCPTGAVLSYLRRHAASGEWTWRDVFAGILLLFALAAWFWN